ncbi:MAG: NADH:flavin oxidoreductase/NADH oxidase [Labilithrix sp.]|nr:NADH:flavin oxidoreductase/NADH oxidase [Labilithrix sp.]
MSLFDTLDLAGVHLKNRIAVSPMCQYSAEEGLPTSWHLVHLGSRAVGGAGLVVVEASAVEARGRITPGDSGIWNDAQAEAWGKVARFVREQGAAPAIQLAHAGRKASTSAPWEGGKGLAIDDGGWETLGPSAIRFDHDYPVPAAMTAAQIDEVVAAFGAAAARAVEAGFEVLEIHGAHGYLLHEFLSPISNQRTDEYGGSFDNRIRFTQRVVREVRNRVPERVPVLLRISATDWAEESDGPGWDLEQSVALVESLAKEVALVDVSSGGNLAAPKIPVGAGYQTRFAAEIRRRTGVKTGAVGMITSAAQADTIIRTEQADLVLLARELLRDPYWPVRAAKELRVKLPAPVQYARAW